MSDFDYIKNIYFKDFSKSEGFCTELYNKIADCTAKLISQVKQAEHNKRVILCSTFKELKNRMITDIKSIKFYNDFEHIIVEYSVYSCSAGEYASSKIVNLELPY